MISIKYQEKWALISLSIDQKFQDEKCIMTCLLKIKCSYFTRWTAVWTTKTRQTKFVLQCICAEKIGEGADGNHIHTHLLTLFVYSQNVTCWYLSNFEGPQCRQRCSRSLPLWIRTKCELLNSALNSSKIVGGYSAFKMPNISNASGCECMQLFSFDRQVNLLVSLQSNCK